MAGPNSVGSGGSGSSNASSYTSVEITERRVRKDKGKGRRQEVVAEAVVRDSATPAPEETAPQLPRGAQRGWYDSFANAFYAHTSNDKQKSSHEKVSIWDVAKNRWHSLPKEYRHVARSLLDFIPNAAQGGATLASGKTAIALKAGGILGQAAIGSSDVTKQINNYREGGWGNVDKISGAAGLARVVAAGGSTAATIGGATPIWQRVDATSTFVAGGAVMGKEVHEHHEESKAELAQRTADNFDEEEMGYYVGRRQPDLESHGVGGHDSVHDNNNSYYSNYPAEHMGYGSVPPAQDNVIYAPNNVIYAQTNVSYAYENQIDGDLYDASPRINPVYSAEPPIQEFDSLSLNPPRHESSYAGPSDPAAVEAAHIRRRRTDRTSEKANASQHVTGRR
ncbi:hypothetical protein [Streptomyces sp. NBC_00986]|uniref:hypothetical protein n=1 Tax=Streptomyces sp. NBC_00986 TaxID=2903702 RepID=UPI00386490B7|nr:hypothetical protein OG504_19830 [Streptomyces sp. NBC_00986]